MPKQVMNYNKTIIYKIVCDDLNIKECYVGHTTSFVKRKASHKSPCNNPNSKSHNVKLYTFIRANGGWNNWSMIEIEKYPCEDKQEACKRERYFMEELKATLNMISSCRNKEDIKQEKKRSRIKNAEHIKQYALEHKAQISERNSKKTNCGCGSIYTHGRRSIHFKTLKHMKFISDKELNDSILEYIACLMA
jgi:hypothetical protein